jgi:Fe-S oxidoreductase
MNVQEATQELRKEILDILSTCINCRFCLPSCPRFDITSGDISQGASGITRALYYTVKWGETDRETLQELRDILYSCMTCKNCEVACKNLSTGTKLVDAIEKGRQLLIEEMVGPMPQQKEVLEYLLRYGNPYGTQPSVREEWLRELNVPLFSQDTGTEVLFYVGCTAFHDAAVKNMAESIIKLLEKAQVRFGVLEDEVCCGNPALGMGELGLFEELCEKNVEQFQKLGVRHIVTLSPHCFDTLVNRYPEEALAGVKVAHYSQFLADLIEQKRLVFKSRLDKRVVYQDPCYLGRHNDIYDAPRKALNSIPGIELVEFPRAMVDSLCCGGGGGRMWVDFASEIDRIANLRVKEALAVGAEIIATACPWCLIMLLDGVKSLNVDNKLAVRDLAELCVEAL